MPVKVDVLVVGAGPAGLAMSASLSDKKINHIVIEKSDCIAPLWQYRTYDGLVLQRRKHVCQLPLLPFPDDSPDPPTRQHFLDYLNQYADIFNINPQFNECVISASFDKKDRCWTVVSEKTDRDLVSKIVYECKMVVVATGRDAKPVKPDDIEGLDDFNGEKLHSSEFKKGENYQGKTVLVIGSGDSAIDILLNLSSHGAHPYMVVRNNLIKDFPKKIKATDLSKMQMNFGEFEMGDPRGEMEINVFPEIKKFKRDSVELQDGKSHKIDCVVMATGYRNDVKTWLETDFFDGSGVRNKIITRCDMMKARLCIIGFKKNGILGIYRDAPKIAESIEK